MRFDHYPFIRLMLRVQVMRYFPLNLSSWRRVRTHILQLQSTLARLRSHLTLCVILTAHLQYDQFGTHRFAPAHT